MFTPVGEHSLLLRKRTGQKIGKKLAILTQNKAKLKKNDHYIGF
jgi:hypothetical protein